MKRFKNLYAQNISGPAGLFGLGVGNVYLVAQSTVSYYKQFEADNQMWYSDGSKKVHTGIQSALNETVAERNDYVIVMPDADDYDLTAGLTMSKKCVHLISPGGIIEGSHGATNATRVDAAALTSGVLLTISAAACEVAGFYFKGDVDTSVIALTSAAHTSNIHHNTIGLSVTSGSASCYGITCASGETSGVTIHHNFITIMYPNAASQTIGGGIYLTNGTRSMITDNVIAVGGFGDTMSVGISAGSGAVSTIARNYLIENTSGTGTDSTFTVGIQLGAGIVAIDNRFAMTTVNNGLAGGTASESGVCNYDSAGNIQNAG